MWERLSGDWQFWFASVLIVASLAMALVPQWLSPLDPERCDLERSLAGPVPAAPFGYDIQGCDVFVRTVYGARGSIAVGVTSALGVLVIGVLVGCVAGYFGGWVDAVLSRLIEVFAAFPVLLGGVLILYELPGYLSGSYWGIIARVVGSIVFLGWPATARLTRAVVLQHKRSDYVLAARALGAGPLRILVGHIAPNGFAPLLAVATINVGMFIAIEGTLSFLGIGLQPPVISWGVAIADASRPGYVLAGPHMLLFPALVVTWTVLGFVSLGESLRQALDPASR